MLNIFAIDFTRQILEQTLYEEHLKNPNYFGGSNQINIFSFYEQLKNQDEVDRFVENYRELTEQQNRTSLIGNGVLVSPENPTITNLYSSLIVPMTWTCSMRTTLGNRDQMISTINNLIDELKGSKVDIAQLKCNDENGKDYYVPFKVGTIGHNDTLYLKNGDYLGEIESITDITTIITALYGKGISWSSQTCYWVYVGDGNKLRVAYFTNYSWSLIVDDGTYDDVIFPPEHTSFEKYKVSMSFDAIRCDEPRTLNSEEYCELTFSGSATLVSNGVKLGNDLLKIGVAKNKIIGSPNITLNGSYYYLEPLEMPSGSNANTRINQLVSNQFISNNHTDALALTLQYTFICDETIDLLEQWFDYARYGTQGLTVNDISPNMIYNVREFWCSWGDFKSRTFLAKIIENIDIENTESDTLTLSITFQVQGANN